jgi:hypothetical protein
VDVNATRYDGAQPRITTMTTKYEVTLAFDVPCYATVSVEAESYEDAIKQALIEAETESFEPEWDCAFAGADKNDDDYGNEHYRLVDVEAVQS